MKRILLSIAIAATLSGCNTVSDWMSSGRAPATAANGVLVGPGGMTLYTFDKDVAASGKSACNGPCATNWPPLLATSDAKSSGDWSVIARDGGARQWAYKGAPLYYWAKDTKPGERTGDGFNGVWRVAKP
jgi:predicted lipoprotein with Yx(FWY)xxD motif